VLLLIIYVFSGATRTNTDKLTDAQAAGQAAASDPEKQCGSQKTYDLIKRELFRRAAELRGRDQPTFDRLSAYSVVRMDAPMLRSHDEDVGTITCAGSLALDLPPGVAVVGGRRTLTAEMDYSLTGAADRSGDVVTLAGADAILVPLATLARTDAQSGQPEANAPAPIDSTATEQGEAPAVSAPPSVAPPPAPPRPQPRQRPEDGSETRPAPAAPPAPPQTARANPSFNCANARTRGERAVCGNSGLANLDRQMSGLFFSALRDASPEQRALLQRTRNRFLTYRDRCSSDACIAGAYRDRIREINDIASDRWQP
jgi:uncharacterized protein YecT (DUF1311 family)